MVDLDGTFDSTKIDPSAPMEPLPTNWYAMQIVKGTKKQVKDSEKYWYLEFECEIIETVHPEYKGRKVWARLNLCNQNEQARDIAQRQLSAICHAVGVPSITDSDQLNFKPMAVRVVLRPPKGQYSESNDVKGFDAMATRFPGGKPAPASAVATETTLPTLPGQQKETAAPSTEKSAAPPWATPAS